jgi:CubicO group peptidase (beta-lactamase class C family)
MSGGDPGRRSSGRGARAVGLAAALALALAALALTAAPAAATGPERALDRFLDRSWPAQAGGTILAARGDRLAACRGIGMADRAAKVPAGCDTVYDLMSITKQFTAAAILKLESIGRLRVSDPIGRFVGPVPADKRGITLHHLLAHTSGLPEAIGDDYEPRTREQLVEGALRSRLRAAPGRAFHYSNAGFSLLAAVVEEASGMGYEQFLAEHLFAPAGMTQTGYVLPEWRRDRVAVEYDARGRSQGRPFEHPWAHDGPHWNLRGNGGMLSTARDMFRWHRALRGDKVLNRRAKRRLFAPRAPIGEGFRSGYGWAVGRTADGRIATHSGGNGWSYGVVARFLDDGAMVFWISNQAARTRRWNLQARARDLTLRIAEAVRP